MDDGGSRSVGVGVGPTPGAKARGDRPYGLSLMRLSTHANQRAPPALA